MFSKFCAFGRAQKAELTSAHLFNRSDVLQGLLPLNIKSKQKKKQKKHLPLFRYDFIAHVLKMNSKQEGVKKNEGKWVRAQ